jgi:sugar lactone lactonase YvrE
MRVDAHIALIVTAAASQEDAEGQGGMPSAAHNAFMQSIFNELLQESHSVPAHMLEGSLLHFPTDVKLLPDGHALVCDNHTQCILIVNPEDGCVLGNFEVRDESGTVRKVSPGSLALSPDGEQLLLLDNVCGSVIFVRLCDGQIVRSLGSRGPLLDQFQEPLEMVLDAHGNVLVSDTGGAQHHAQSRIIVFRPDGSTALVQMPGRVNGGMLIDARGRLNFFCDHVLYRTCF